MIFTCMRALLGIFFSTEQQVATKQTKLELFKGDSYICSHIDPHVDPEKKRALGFPPKSSATSGYLLAPAR